MQPVARIFQPEEVSFMMMLQQAPAMPAAARTLPRGIIAIGLLLLTLIFALPSLAYAEPWAWPEWWPRFLSAQITVIWQRLFPLHSPYEGENSFPGRGDSQVSHTYGLYLGSQVTTHLQAYLDVEMARGTGVNRGAGVGGYTNGDVIRIGSVDLGEDPYIARAYVRYVVPLSGETETVDRDIDHLPGQQPVRRVEIKLGKLAATDDFDLNRYANSTRAQFMNWGLFNNTAWDFAADTRGYSNGIMLAWITPRWTLRLGSYQMPTKANGNVFDNDILRAHGDNLELTLRPNELGTVVRLLAYANHARMGEYRVALDRARANGTTPSITLDERPGRLKYGFGINVEQPLADGGETGAFLRVGWNDGHTEEFTFTEVDGHLSAGVQVSGVNWGRPEDRVGVGAALHWLSPEHREYLAAGGSGFMLGDGRLTYGVERLFEVYYRWQLGRFVQIGPDFQYIDNPGYNRDRGPASLFSLRLRLSY